MQLLVLTVIAFVVFLLAIGLDLGGTIGFMLFLVIVLIGGTLRAWDPLVVWLRGPSAGSTASEE